MSNEIGSAGGIIGGPRVTPAQAQKAVEPKPGMGRIVRYHPTPEQASSAGGNAPSPQGWPAVMVAVNSDTSVNLKVFSDGVHDFWVPMASKGTGAGEWEWPPRL